MKLTTTTSGLDTTERGSRLGILDEPLGYVDGANLYEFVRDDPTGLLDPTGEQAAATQPTTQPTLKFTDIKFNIQGADFVKLLAGKLDSFGCNYCGDVTIESLQNPSVTLSITGFGRGLFSGVVKQNTGVDIDAKDINQQLEKMLVDQVQDQKISFHCQSGKCGNKKHYDLGEYPIDIAISGDVGLGVGVTVKATLKGMAKLSGDIGHCE